MHMKDLTNVLARLYHAGQSVELVGGPGIGKSDMMKQVRALLQEQIGEPVGLVTTILSQRDAVDIGGFMVPKERPDGTIHSKFSMPSVFPQSWMFPEGQIPKHGIVFLDERAQANHDVQKTCAQLLLDHRIGEYSLDTYGHWVTWTASNRMTDRSGTFRNLAFLTNRLLMINVTAHPESWGQWAETNGVNPLFVAFGMRNPALVFHDAVPEEDGPFCTPRTLVMASKVTDALGFNHPQLTETLAGLLGEGTAAQLMSFAKVIDVVPTIEEILAQPTKAAVPGPDRPDAQYFAMQLVIHHVTDRNCLKLLKYLERLPREFLVSGVHGAVRSANSLISNAEFGKWVAKNRDLVNVTLGNV